MLTNKRYVYVNAHKGEPLETDFELVTEEVPPLEKGEVLCEALYIGVDPCHHRLLYKDLTEGQTMMGTQVAKVVESADDQWPVGGMVVGDFGWQLYTLCRPGASLESSLNCLSPRLLHHLGHFPASLALGLLGTPGNIAYCGLLETCRPEEGEVVVISSAGCTVGSIAAQIAKIKGCVVVGIVESEEKAKWLRDLSLDAVINLHTTSDLDTALREAAPHGVNYYIENEGGELSAVVVPQMNMHGRIVYCGAAGSKIQLAPNLQPYIISKQLRMEAMIPQHWSERRDESYKALSNWILEGKIQYREMVFEGFKKLPQAFITLIQGKNVGDVIVRA